MKRITILILQIFTMLMFISNHFLNEMLGWYPTVWFFGIKMSNLIVDVTIYVPIILQIIVIILMAKEEVRK